jgi:ribose transport system permease protein
MIKNQKGTVVHFILEYNVFFVLLLLVLISLLLSEVFFTWRNITNLLRQLVPLMLISIGMLMVVLTGGIDLSVGSVAAVASVTCAYLLAMVLKPLGIAGLFLSILITLLAGVCAGAITGTLTSYFKIAPFVASLAMMTIARGMAYIITSGEPIRLDVSTPSNQILANFGNTSVPFLSLPWPIVLGAAVLIIFYLLVKYTAFGRLSIAIGSNESAVRLAGIVVEKYKMTVYVLSGMLSALAGIVITSRSGVGVPTSGTGLELDALAACVIGGASLSGGNGRVLNTLIGVLVLGLIGNIMVLMSVPVYPQQIIKGVIIVLAVLLQSLKK